LQTSVPSDLPIDQVPFPSNTESVPSLNNVTTQSRGNERLTTEVISSALTPTTSMESPGKAMDVAPDKHFLEPGVVPVPRSSLWQQGITQTVL